jgi:hypothetical protein
MTGISADISQAAVYLFQDVWINALHLLVPKLSGMN